MIDIRHHLVQVQNRIREYEKKYTRIPGSVTLLAVSKGQSAEQIKAAWDVGQRCFGENYLQEAVSKMQALAEQSIEWHFIGSIQRNKTQKIAKYFDWVHSVSSLEIAKRLNEQRPMSLSPLQICLAVNIDQENTKSGLYPDEVFLLAREMDYLPQLQLRGLMTIPRRENSLAAQRVAFQKLRVLYDELHAQHPFVDTLSMGMSTDFEAAIAEGSTIVRIGTAIFGERC